ncbi:hypothetical protein BGZ80_006336, partial [Entomortierella chlamydospora]
MSKSGAQSVSASASASASSYDPHSLPPNVKGLIQRYLAVSLPTINLTPEFIDVLDKSSILIPSKIKVTMRWWKEDSASSLSVFPKLNSPLPEAIERNQNLLRLKQQQEKHHQRQHQHQDKSLDRQQNSTSQLSHRYNPTIPTLSSSNTQPSTSTQAHHRSAAASFLKRPWSGARLLSVFRKGKKSKEHKAAIPDTAAQDVSTSINPTTDAKNIDALKSTHVGAGLDSVEADAKPLPSLPESAFPITVAYPIRCSLDQLHRYFLEMTSLNLEIQITPDLTIITAVPNIIDLFRNINATFSGVFPFSTVVQNNDPRLRSEKLFKKRVVLGMVVFQAWSQDTSDVGDDSDESDSVSTRSVLAMLEENGATRHPHHSHRRQNSLHDQYIRSAYRPEQHTPPPPPQFPQSSQRAHPAHPALGPPHPHGSGQNPYNPVKPVNPIQHPMHQHHLHQSHLHQPHLQQLQQHGEHRHQQVGIAPPRTQFPREQGHMIQGRPNDHDGYTPRISMHYGEGVPSGDHRTFLSRPYGAGVADDSTFRNKGTQSRQDIHRSSRERLPYSFARQPVSGQSGGPVRNQSRYTNVRIPAPGVDPSNERPLHYDRYNCSQPTSDEYFHDDLQRREDNTNPLSQNSRSRPRASATAAAIGRLNSVLARGEDLRQGMRTSLALDPEEVRVMSTRNIRSSAMRDDIDDDRYLPYHEVLPYWPSKSKFSLEMSIPTAYLTSRGLLKGSHGRKHTSKSTLRSGQDRPPTSQRMDWERAGDSRTPYRQSPILATETSEQQQHQRPIRQVSPQYQTSLQGRTRQPATGPTLVTSTESAPRLLRRSGRPIQFGKISP